MKFKFNIQSFQTEAVNSVVGVFAGQPFNDRFTYRRDVEIERNLLNAQLSDEELTMGFANAKVQLGNTQLLDNIHKIQTRNNIKLSETVSTGGIGACSLDVEMETGTGKTYVYIKTMFELNKQYGWSKFIVVVPNIAIVKASARVLRLCRITSWNITAKKLGSLCTIQRISQILIVLVKVRILMS